MNAESPASSDSEPDLGAVIFACLQDVEAGRRPDRERLMCDHPRFAGELKTFFCNQDRLERLAAPLRDVMLLAETGALSGQTTQSMVASPGSETLGALGDYELLAEVGRGGMGVVYQARQRGLNRVVALKVIAGGGIASLKERQRFRSEAETVAALDHPHIVPIYEVGEVGEYLFFSMRYLEGGSLNGRLARFQHDPRSAARLLATLARAVHFAHERGILHRDLKPANILLDAQENPYVSDFGLAKRLPTPGKSGADELTQSGSIVGSPLYMAPEQAAPASGPVTTAADVYGLGGILYALLTGRAPFKGATILETLEQVMRRDPRPPRQDNPRVDRNLETICLKCLEKLPSRRYASAAALAEDLERWLAGEPIRARRASAGERLWKWARRRPGPAALAASCLAFILALLMGGAVYEHRLRAALSEAREQRVRADENFRQAQAHSTRADDNYKKARATLRKMLQRTRDPRYNEVPRLMQLERAQAEEALAFFDQIAAQQSNDPAVRQDVAQACLEAGKLQLELGQRARALESFRRADRLSQAAGHDAPDDRELGLFRADVFQSLGLADAQEQSTPWLEQAVTLLERLLETHPVDPQVRQQLAGANLPLSAAYLKTGKVDRAERALLAAMDLYTSLLHERPGDRELRVLRAGAQVNLAVVYRQQKKDEALTRHNREAEADLEQAVAADPSDTIALRRLAVLRINGAYDIASRRQHEEALAYVTRNVAMLEAALEREPDHVDLRESLRGTHGVRATMLEALHCNAECVKAWEQMMQYSRPADAAAARYTLVNLLRQAGELNRAIAEADTIRAELTRSPVASGWKILAGYYQNLAGDAGKDSRLWSEQRRQLQDRLRAAGREAGEQAEKIQK